MNRLGAFVFVLSLAGCGGVPPVEPPDGDVEIGTGASSGDPGFVAFEAGATLELVPGSQGGFHVFVNLRLPAGSEERFTAFPRIRRVARRVEDGLLVSRTDRREPLEADAQGALRTPASLPLFLCPTPIGVSVGDAPIELQVEVTHPDGTATASARIELVPVCPEGTQSGFCQSICYG